MTIIRMSLTMTMTATVNADPGGRFEPFSLQNQVQSSDNDDDHDDESDDK